LRYRKAVTYGFHALLGALETHETEAIRAASAKTLVLWSFYSPDFAALPDELAATEEAAPARSTSPAGRARERCIG